MDEQIEHADPRAGAGGPGNQITAISNQLSADTSEIQR
jgi:hypothetical protein